MIAGLRHTGLVVTDLDESLAFYQALGLKLAGRRRESGPYIDSVVGLKDADLEWAKLEIPGGGLLELIQYHSHPDRPQARPANAHGCSHVAFTVSNLAEALVIVEKRGGSQVGAPAVDPAGKHRVVYAADNSGIIIELVEVIQRA